MTLTSPPLKLSHGSAQASALIHRLMHTWHPRGFHLRSSLEQVFFKKKKKTKTKEKLQKVKECKEKGHHDA